MPPDHDHDNNPRAVPLAESAVRDIRDTTLDFVKGALVVLMVVYHALSIASQAEFEHFRHLRFVSGSFLFLTGFMVARFVRARFNARPETTSLRLLTRGAKILLVFFGLNLAIHVTGVGNLEKVQLGVAGFIRVMPDIFILGDGSVASFIILLPIAYLLLLSPVVLEIARRVGDYAPIFVLLVSMVLAMISAITASSAIVEFLLVGMVGLSAGQIMSSRSITVPWRNPHPVLAVSLLLGSVAFSGYLNFNVAAYIFGLSLVLSSLYGVGKCIPPNRPTYGHFVLLGRYSLFCYILQILIIQLLFRISGAERWSVGSPEIWGVCIGTTAGLVVICILLDSLRERGKMLDRLYKLVFS